MALSGLDHCFAILLSTRNSRNSRNTRNSAPGRVAPPIGVVGYSEHGTSSSESGCPCRRRRLGCPLGCVLGRDRAGFLTRFWPKTPNGAGVRLETNETLVS